MAIRAAGHLGCDSDSDSRLRQPSPRSPASACILRPYVDDGPPRRCARRLADPEVLKPVTGSVHDEAAELVPENPAEEKKWRNWYSARSDQPDRLDLAVIDRSGGGCVGEAVLNEWDPGNQNLQLSHRARPRGSRGRGLGAEATRLIVGYGFERLGMHRISLGGVLAQPARPPCLRESRFPRRGRAA